MFRGIFFIILMLAAYFWIVSTGSEKKVIAMGKEFFKFVKKMGKDVEIDWNISENQASQRKGKW